MACEKRFWKLTNTKSSKSKNQSQNIYQRIIRHSKENQGNQAHQKNHGSDIRQAIKIPYLHPLFFPHQNSPSHETN